MKKFTIKVLVLSLLMLVTPKSFASPSLFFLGVGLSGGVIGIGVTAIVGAVGFVGYKVVKHISLTPEQRAEIKREKLEARKKRNEVLALRKKRKDAQNVARKKRKADKLEAKNNKKAERIAQKKAKKMKLNTVIKKEDVTQEVLSVSVL